MTDVHKIGEEDSRLLPALDAWLSNRLPYLQFSRGVDSCDSYGSTLLMVAACFGKVACVRRLLAAGANANHVNRSGRSALVYACLGPDLPKHNTAILEALLKHGASHGLRDALEAAALLGRRPEVRVLVAAGALGRDQVCKIFWPSLPDFHRAVCSVTSFDPDAKSYQVILLSSTESGRLLRVPAGQLHVELHHLAESSEPILASGGCPLDVAAGALAGAPAALVPLRRRGAASPALDDCADAASTTSSIVYDVSGRFTAGAPVRIAARPEQWLRGRPGRVSSWDATAGRYMVSLPARRGEMPVFDADSLRDTHMVIMILPEHLDAVTEADYQHEAGMRGNAHSGRGTPMSQLRFCEEEEGEVEEADAEDAEDS